jgi:predicted porin
VTAASAQSTVTISGSIGLTLANVTEGQATVSRQSLNRSTGAIQVSGTEDLGGGLKAGFRFEELIAGGQTSAARVTTGTGLNTGNFGSRQSFLTVGGGFGTVKVGRDLDANAQLIGVGNISGVNAWKGLDDNTDNAVYYGNVRANSISYTSPAFMGFTVGYGLTPSDYAGLSTKAGATAAATNTLCVNDIAGTAAAAGTCTATILAATNPVAASTKQDNASAIAVSYANGPLNAGYVRTDAQTSINIVVNSFAANYDFGVAKVGAAYQTVEADGKAKRTATLMSINVPVGAFAFQAATGKSDASTAFSSSFAKEVKQTMIGVQYNLSKRTSAYFVSNNKKVDGATANDGDSKETGFGIKHAF